MNITKKVQYPHIWLYAKNWYEQTNLMDDLKKIIAFENCCDINNVREINIFEIILHETFPYLREKNDGNLVQWFIECFKNWESLSISKWYKDSITREDIIRNCLSVLSQVKIKNNNEILIDIGNPNPNVLPLRKEK